MPTLQDIVKMAGVAPITASRVVDYVQWGGVSGIDTGTRGTEYFDGFVSRRTTFTNSSTSFVEPPLQPVGPRLANAELKPFSGGKVLAAPALLNQMADELVGTSITSATPTGAPRVYDPLNRLTRATYSDGSFFAYTYDAVGRVALPERSKGSNRLTETTQAGTVNYVYDAANRLTSVGGVSLPTPSGAPRVWDNNGNLLSDGTSTYTYDHANRLKSVVQGANTYTYQYNGKGNRVSQSLNGGAPTRYVLDQAAGLTQVLSDGTNTYLYGNERIAQQASGGREYFLVDALGSVRQMVDGTGTVILTKSYKPFGEVLNSQGSGASIFGYTAEQKDSTGLVNLRARMYSSATGRFLGKDTWKGNDIRPTSYNAWLYTYSNPINLIDPSGHDSYCDGPYVASEDCRFIIHQRRNAISDYAQNYGEKIPPPGIIFTPSGDPLIGGANGLTPGDDFSQKILYKNTSQPNLCGLAAVTAILNTVNPELTILEVMDAYVAHVKNFGNGIVLEGEGASELVQLIKDGLGDYAETMS